MKCRKCIMISSKLGFSVDSRGVCNACQNAEINDRIDWVERWLELKAATCLAKKTMGYSCVVPVSGGKDSMFLALKARELGLNPLCVNVRPCVPTERGERNLYNLSSLGFDIFRFIPNAKIMPELVKRSFVEDGDPCTSHEFMLYSVPVRVAIQYKVPLIIWAENPQFEYGNSGEVKDANEQRNIAGLWGRSASYWESKTVTANNLISFEHPTRDEITNAGVRAIYLSDYIRWDSRKIAEFAVGHGLEVREQNELEGTGGYWNFEQLDDETPVIGHYLKYLKFGYGRATDQACRDIRLGYTTREEGLELAEKYDGRINSDYIERFCKYIDITRKEFDEICKTFEKEKK